MLYAEKYNQYSDNELISEYKQTQNNVFLGILYKRYAHLVLGLSIKYLKDEDEAKDAVMQIFEKLLSDLLKYDIEYFKSWLYTFSKNHCLMILRTKQSLLKKQSDLKESTSLFMESDENSHHSQEKEKQYQLLESSLNELNTEQRTCVKLFYIDQKSYIEIADITGYSLNEVKSYIQNGKRNLKIKMENNREEE